MGGAEPESQEPREREDVAVVARNARAGLVLFAVYVLLYGGFMALTAFSFETMAVKPFGGVNLAILYGFGLIISALILALIYMVICRKPARGKPCGATDGRADQSDHAG